MEMGNDIWTVKYRPRSLADIAGNEKTVDLLNQLIKSNNLPHLVFHGSSGTGKSSTAFALAHDLYGPGSERNFTYFNASDFFDMGKRYIVRDKRFRRIIGTDDPKKVRVSVISIFKQVVNEYASMSPIDHDYKIIFIDNAESLDSSSQHALRRIMERYTSTTRFILATTQPSKLISPLRSRGLQLYFSHVPEKKFIEHMENIALSENMKVIDSGLEALFYHSKGNIEKGIITLQLASTFTDGSDINQEHIYEAVLNQTHENIVPLFEAAISGKIQDARKIIDTLLIDSGMSGTEIIEHLYHTLIESNEPDRDIARMMTIIAITDYRMIDAANDRIQLENMIADF